MDELALVPPVGVVLDTTRVIIDSIWSNFEREASNAISLLRDEDKFESLVSHDFSRFLHEIKAHSKHCPNYILKKLIDWRQQRMLSVNHKFDTDPSIENPTRSLYSIAVNIIYVRSILMVVTSSTDNIASDLSLILQNQGFECFCDILPLHRRSTTIAKIKKKIFNNYINNSSNSMSSYSNNNTPLEQKRKLLFNLWCTLIGLLSINYLETITLRLQDIMENDIERADQSGIARLIRGMRSIKLDLSTIPSITKSYNFVRYLLTIFDNCHSSKIKRAIGETLTLILYPLADKLIINIDNNSISVREWWKTIYNVYMIASLWSRKKKYILIALPLMMSALCVMEKESFLSHRLICCDKIYKFINSTSMKYKTIGLACLRRILETYLKHFADGQTGTETHLQNLNNQILFQLKWDNKGEHQDGIVAYILTIAEKKPKLALATIVSSCLQLGSKNKHCLPGLRALNGILYGDSSDMLTDDDNTGWNNNNNNGYHIPGFNKNKRISTRIVITAPSHHDDDNNNNNLLTFTPSKQSVSSSHTTIITTTHPSHPLTHNDNDNDSNNNNNNTNYNDNLLEANDDIIQTIYGPNLSNVLKSLIRNKIKPVSNNVLDSDIEGILCAAISQILRETKCVMLRHGSIRGSSIDVYDDDQRNLAMFRLCILCLPRLHIWSPLSDEYDIIDTSDLIYLLAMSCISQHERIASAAQHVSVYLMRYHIELRSNVLQDTSTYLLQQHGDNVTNISTLLTMLDEFIQIWLAQINDNNQKCKYERSILDISKVEAAAAFSLTSTSSVVRQNALNVIKLCYELGKYQTKQMQQQAASQHINDDDDTLSSNQSLNNISSQHQHHHDSHKWPDVRLHEIIIATEKDIQRRYTHSCDININSVEIINISQLALGESKEEQLEWSMCLGSILQKAVHSRCKCLKYAYEKGKMHVDSVLKCIRNHEYDENMIGIWTNFVLFITICVAIIDPIPAAAEELFQRLIPLLSTDRLDIQFIASLSLGKIDPTMILTLMKCLESIQHSVFSLKRKPKYFIRLLQNLAYIYRFLAEDVDKSTIFSSETIRERMISFVEKTMKFMDEFRANLRNDCLTIRIHFCIIVRNLLEKWPTNIDGLDPIPARLRRRLFDFMISWSGQSARKLNKTSISLIKNSKNNDVNQQKLEFSALAAIAALLRGQSFEDITNLRDGIVFKWIRNVVASDDPQVAILGSLALQSYLSCNYDDIEDFIEECYNNNHIISKTFFIVLCEVWLNDHFNIPKPVLFHLAIYKMGDISMRVRSASLKIGREIPCLIPPEIPINPLNFIISSRLPDSYIRAQKELSAQLAAAYPSLSPSIIREFGDRLSEAEISNVGVMLNYMIPWFKNIDLNASNGDNNFVMDILFRTTIDYGTQFTDSISSVWTGLTFKEDNIPIILNYVLKRCEYDNEYEKWVAIEASKRIALYCSRRYRKYTIQHLISIINQQSIDPNDFNDDEMSEHMIDIPEDPRTSLSTPAPPPYKRNIKNNTKDTNIQFIINRKQQFSSPFQSPTFRKEQLQLVQNVGFNIENNNNNNNKLQSNKVVSTKTQSKHPILSHNISNNNNNNNNNINGGIDDNIYVDDSFNELNINRGDYALMLLVELAYEMDKNDDDFEENLSLMLHVGILGLDHPFRSLGEHCKRLLMNLLHSIYFRHDGNINNKNGEAQELMLYLVRNRGKLMWQREMINSSKLFLKSSRYLQFLVQWLTHIIINNSICTNTAQYWSSAAIDWVEKCTSPFIACRSLQIYRSLQKYNKQIYNKNIFNILMKILEDNTKHKLWSEILSLMKTWTQHIPTNEIQIWTKLIWNTINICRYEPAHSNKPHIYVHGLSLLASILKHLNINATSNEIWDNVVKQKLNMINTDINYNNNPNSKSEILFEGIQTIAIKGLLCNTTKIQSEEFLSGLILMNNHIVLYSHSSYRVHIAILSQLPSICYYLYRQSIYTTDQLTISHMRNMSKSVSIYFYNQNIKTIAIPFENVSKSLLNDLDKFLSQILKPIARWISLTNNADINIVVMLLELLDHSDIEYKRQTLCILHGILLWIEWDESVLRDVDSNFFDKITDLLASQYLWREATMILEVVVKFNNNSSKSPSLLFSPDPAIKPNSPRKHRLSLDPDPVTLHNDEFIPNNHLYPYNKLECANFKGGFQPNKVSQHMPPFSPMNLRTKQMQQHRRNNIIPRKLIHPDPSTPPPPSINNNNNNNMPWTPPNNTLYPNDNNQSMMASQALATWQLVVRETRTEQCCSPLPSSKAVAVAVDNKIANISNIHEEKVVSDLLMKSSILFKNNNNNRNDDTKTTFDKLSSFIGLKRPNTPNLRSVSENNNKKSTRSSRTSSVSCDPFMQKSSSQSQSHLKQNNQIISDQNNIENIENIENINNNNSSQQQSPPTTIKNNIKNNINQINIENNNQKQYGINTNKK